jgi:hypothetical protein
MWQRFTERARRVVFFAQEEAARLGENTVGTEHLLLGLVREYDSVAGKILTRLGISQSDVQAETNRHVTRGEGNMGQDMQLTPRSKRVIDLAYEEARLLENNYIGTEHLLLGLAREGDGLGFRVLRDLGCTLERARAVIRQMQAKPGEAPSQPEPARWEPLRGDVGVLHSQESDRGRSHVEVTFSREAAAELRDLFVSTRDPYGYREMRDAGKFKLLPVGTEVKLLRIEGEPAYQVRIFSGVEEGKIGWILPRHFKSKGSDRRPFPPFPEEPAGAAASQPEGVTAPPAAPPGEGGEAPG